MTNVCPERPGVRNTHGPSVAGICPLPYRTPPGRSHRHTLGQEEGHEAPGIKAYFHPRLLHPLERHEHQIPLLAGGSQTRKEPSFTRDPRDSQSDGGGTTSFRQAPGPASAKFPVWWGRPYTCAWRDPSLLREAWPLPRNHFWSNGEGSALALRNSQCDEGGTTSQRQVPTQ